MARRSDPVSLPCAASPSMKITTIEETLRTDYILLKGVDLLDADTLLSIGQIASGGSAEPHTQPVIRRSCGNGWNICRCGAYQRIRAAIKPAGRHGSDRKLSRRGFLKGLVSTAWSVAIRRTLYPQLCGLKAKGYAYRPRSFASQYVSGIDTDGTVSCHRSEWGPVPPLLCR